MQITLKYPFDDIPHHGEPPLQASSRFQSYTEIYEFDPINTVYSKQSSFY